MEPLSDIVVLDFCEWLNQHLNNINDNPEMIDIIMNTGNSQFKLEEYAQNFLASRKTTDCLFQDIMTCFFKSKEYRDAIKRCYRHGHRSNRDCSSCNDIYNYIFCPKIEYAFHCFIKDYKLHGYTPMYMDISADHLAEYTREIILHGNPEDNIHKQPPMMKLMMNLSMEISKELDFFNWLSDNMEWAADFWKMPSDVFEKVLEKYIIECKKTELDKRQLLKSYRRTGWNSFLEKINVLLHLKKYTNKNLNEVLRRYYSHQVRFKCIIFPLSDPKSQRIYRSLINESWEDLNSCSGDYLDIYYSEVDTGKSGFDIAKRIDSLPKQLKHKAPCIIIWEQSMQDAEALSIVDLDNIQIVELIKFLVENIQNDKSFDSIIKEAKNKVKELQDEKKPIRNYYAPVITGDGNVVGDNNAVGTGNISGTSNTMTGNRINVNNLETISKTLEEFETALCAIHDSQELDDNMKAQLAEIMKIAKSGVFEQSIEKQEQAKTAFGYIKSFLIKVAPNLVEVLANISTIATFFGVML